MNKFKDTLIIVCLMLLVSMVIWQGYAIRETKADLGDRWSITDGDLRDILTIPTNPGAEYLEWSRQCTPIDSVIADDTIGIYMRQKGDNLNLMGKDDAGYEFQVGGANMYWNQGCDISGDGSDGDVATAITTPLQFGRGVVFNLLNGGSFQAGFQETNIDQKDRIIVLVADRNTILEAHPATTNLGLKCNLNMAAGFPHMFRFDGCKWYPIGHHNNF